MNCFVFFLVLMNVATCLSMYGRKFAILLKNPIQTTERKCPLIGTPYSSPVKKKYTRFVKMVELVL